MNDNERHRIDRIIARPIISNIGYIVTWRGEACHLM